MTTIFAIAQHARINATDHSLSYGSSHTLDGARVVAFGGAGSSVHKMPDDDLTAALAAARRGTGTWVAIAAVLAAEQAHRAEHARAGRTA